FDLKTRKSDVPIGGVRSFEISRTGEKMLYRKGDRWLITAPKPMPTGPGAPPPPPAPPTPPGDGALKTEGIEVRADPPAEWRQMYHEVWRIERDFFYDPHFHGLNLEQAERVYAPFLDRVA